MSQPRVVFAGTPDFAATHLQALLDAGLAPVAVYTQPDRPAGRGKKLTPSPVKALALNAGLAVEQPSSLKDSASQARLAAIEADVMVVVAYGLILPQAVLDLPQFGCINVHASLLPRWRGAAPIQRAIEAGDVESGVTLMQMDAGLDTGDMLATVHTPISSRMTGGELHDLLADIGPPALVALLQNLPASLKRAIPQDDKKACYAAKIDKAEAALDWSKEAIQLDRQIRAFNPFPTSWTTLDGQRLKIWAAEPQPPLGGAPGEILSADERGLLVACGVGALRITRLQLAGGKALDVNEVLKARRDTLAPGKVFGH